MIPPGESPERILPSGPDGPAGFGAAYTRLNYTKQWDRLWRVGENPDILVRLAENNCRLVFWRGTSFVPCWVTENGIWYTNEWCETWGKDVVSCAEPLMDRDCRFSHVRIIENSPARTIVHWRYALVDTEYTPVAVDVDGKGEWADETYIIYPDGIGIRKIDLFYSNPLRKHDWEEAIILLSPGQHPDEVVNDPEVTLANMAGEHHDGMQGVNLQPAMRDSATKGREDWYYEHVYTPEPGRRPIPRIEGVRGERWKYTRYTDPQPPLEQLFDLAADPKEEKDHASDPAQAGILATLRARCDEYRKALQ